MAQDEVLGFAQERSLMILCFNLRPVRSVNHHCMQALISEINISTIPNNTLRHVLKQCPNKFYCWQCLAAFSLHVIEAAQSKTYLRDQAIKGETQALAYFELSRSNSSSSISIWQQMLTYKIISLSSTTFPCGLSRLMAWISLRLFT